MHAIVNYGHIVKWAGVMHQLKNKIWSPGEITNYDQWNREQKLDQR